MALPENAPKEQTMDEILASIRRIIESHDEPEAVAVAPQPERSVARAAPRDPAADMHAFRNALNAQRQDDVPVAPSPRPVADGRSHGAVTLPGDRATSAAAPTRDEEAFSLQREHPAAATQAAESAPLELSAIVSQEPSRKVAAAFDELQAIMNRSSAKPLNETAEDMLRPMLREWLDENLPSIVERLVREEIERIARGGI